MLCGYVCDDKSQEITEKSSLVLSVRGENIIDQVIYKIHFFHLVLILKSNYYNLPMSSDVSTLQPSTHQQR